MGALKLEKVPYHPRIHSLRLPHCRSIFADAVRKKQHKAAGKNVKDYRLLPKGNRLPKQRH